MSYILSALRKAEEERKQGQTPIGERVLSAQPAPVRHARARNGLWLVGIVTLFIAVAVFWLAKSGSGEQSRGKIDVREFSQNSPNVEPSEKQVRTELKEEISRQAPEKGLPASKATPSEEHQAASSVSRPLPALNITGYIYFEDRPDSSKLFVDGIVYRLGSRLSDGLVITGFHVDSVAVEHFGVPREIAIP